MTGVGRHGGESCHAFSLNSDFEASLAETEILREGHPMLLTRAKNVARLSAVTILTAITILTAEAICLSANGAAYAQSATQSQAATQAQFDRTVEQYTCKDIVREAGGSRDVAVAFLHGYLLGKSGSSKFNIETLQKQTDAFLERCLDNPKDKAEDVMMQIKK